MAKFAVVVALIAVLGCASAQQICETFGSTTVGNKYIVMNNKWGTSAEQCIEPVGNGFFIRSQKGQAATNGPPVSYPAIYIGCHYSACSPNSPLPKQVNQIGAINADIGYTFVAGTYDAAYDIWLDPNRNIDSNNAMEIMIWFNRQGSIQPIGSQTSTANIAGITWAVWQGSNGSNNVISYVAPNPVTGLTMNVMDFIRDGINRGLYNDQWWLTSIQAGFEPWIGGEGLGVNRFEVNM